MITCDVLSWRASSRCSRSKQKKHKKKTTQKKKKNLPSRLMLVLLFQRRAAQPPFDDLAVGVAPRILDGTVGFWPGVAEQHRPGGPGDRLLSGAAGLAAVHPPAALLIDRVPSSSARRSSSPAGPRSARTVLSRGPAPPHLLTETAQGFRVVFGTPCCARSRSTVLAMQLFHLGRRRGSARPLWAAERQHVAARHRGWPRPIMMAPRSATFVCGLVINRLVRRTNGAS